MEYVLLVDYNEEHEILPFYNYKGNCDEQHFIMSFYLYLIYVGTYSVCMPICIIL